MNTQSITIRLAVASDTESVTAFVDEMLLQWKADSSMQSDGSCCPARSTQNVYDEIFASLMDGRLVTAWLGNALGGFLVVSLGPRWMRQAEFRLLNVHPKARGTGIGRAIFGKALCLVAERFYRIVIHETWRDNGSVRRLFEASGSVFVAERRGVVQYVNKLPQVLRSLDALKLQDVAMGNFKARAQLAQGFHHIILTCSDSTLQARVLV